MRGMQACGWCGEDFSYRTMIELGQHEQVHRKMDEATKDAAIRGLMKLFEMSAARTTRFHLGE